MEFIEKLKSPSKDRINISKLIKLTKKEKYFLKNDIYCNEFTKKTYNYYGAITTIQEYLRENLIGVNDNKFIKILLKIINKVGKCYSNILEKYIWLSIRTTNSYIWKNVRWHVDGNYYKHDGKLHSKFIATLCGSPTYGINATQDDKNALLSKDKQLEEQFNSKKININYSIIKVGTNNNSKNCRQIHSEPVNIEPNKRRVFISILYGTKEEIEEWEQKKEIK